jgi:hypothetical protein
VTWVAALLCIPALSVVGCRDSGAPSATPPPLSLALHFAQGDLFVFDCWDLDEFGYEIPSSIAQRTWRVVETGAATLGKSGVIALIESVATGQSPPAPSDTIFFWTAPNGDLFRYGLLADLARRDSMSAVAPRWDCIVAVSAGRGGSWEVGAIDSAAGVVVYGRISVAPDYFLVTVNGVREMVNTVDIDLTGGYVQYSFGIADTPTAFLFIEEAPPPTGKGRLYLLNEIRQASAGAR